MTIFVCRTQGRMIKLQLLQDRIEGHWDPERLTQVMTNLINNAVQHVLFDVTEILRNEGYAVTTATNGLEALTLLRSGVRPKVILTDVIMPEMDGERLCAACHEDPALSNIPVVLLSGDAGAAARAKRSGAAGFVRKPVQPDKLVRAIGRTWH